MAPNEKEKPKLLEKGDLQGNLFDQRLSPIRAEIQNVHTENIPKGRATAEAIKILQDKKFSNPDADKARHQIIDKLLILSELLSARELDTKFEDSVDSDVEIKMAETRDISIEQEKLLKTDMTLYILDLIDKHGGLNNFMQKFNELVSDKKSPLIMTSVSMSTLPAYLKSNLSNKINLNNIVKKMHTGI